MFHFVLFLLALLLTPCFLIVVPAQHQHAELHIHIHTLSVIYLKITYRLIILYLLCCCSCVCNFVTKYTEPRKANLRIFALISLGMIMQFSKFSYFARLLDLPCSVSVFFFFVCSVIFLLIFIFFSIFCFFVYFLCFHYFYCFSLAYTMRSKFKKYALQ